MQPNETIGPYLNRRSEYHWKTEKLPFCYKWSFEQRTIPMYQTGQSSRITRKKQWDEI